MASFVDWQGQQVKQDSCRVHCAMAVTELDYEDKDELAVAARAGDADSES